MRLIGAARLGTNYYVETHEGKFHLGKTSVGWRFGFHADKDWPRDEALTLWYGKARSGSIVDEYGQYFSLDHLLFMIMIRQDGLSHTEDHGPKISGPYWEQTQESRWRCHGFDFTGVNFF